MESSLRRILLVLGLEDCIQTFQKNGVTVESIPHLSNDDMKALGVTKIGSMALLRHKCSSSGLAKLSKDRVAQAVAKKFKTKGGNKMVSFNFVCLAEKDMEFVPGVEGKMKLQRSGLGEKKITIDSNATEAELKNEIYANFSSLIVCGGFEFMRVKGNCKQLNIIAPGDAGYTPAYLRMITKSGRIYLRPIQVNIEVDEENCADNSDGCDTCLKCFVDYPMSKLRDHIETCGGTEQSVTENHVAGKSQSCDTVEIDLKTETSTSPYRSVTEIESTKHASGKSESCDTIETDRRTVGTSKSPYSQYCSILSETIVLSDSDDELEIAIARSMEKEINEPVKTASELFNSLNHVGEDSNSSMFNIHRTKIWDCAVRGLKRKSFDPNNRVSVMFTDSIGQAEGAIDVGGPRREFFNLVLEHIITSNMFEGPLNKRVLTFNGTAMANDDYFFAGRLLAMSLVHGGPAPTFFSKTLYESLAYGFERATPGIEDIGDFEIRTKMERIQSAGCVAQLEDAVNEAEDFLSLAGCLTHVTSLNQKSQLVARAVRFYVLDRNRSAYERFRCGLETLSVLHTVRKNPVVCRKAFIDQEAPKVNAKILAGLFQIKYSETGSNQRLKEEETMSYWLDYLQDVEESQVQCSLKDILVFTSGMSSIPITCFPNQPSIEFENESKFPTANTCAIIIRLPTSHTSYESFRDGMDFAILNSQSFGLA